MIVKKVLLSICAASLAASLMAGCSIFDSGSSGSASATKSNTRPDAVTLSGKYDGFGFQALQTVGEMRLYDALDTAVNKPQGEEFVTQYRPVYTDLDVNGHMNNTRYADLLCNALGIDLMKEFEPDLFDGAGA